MEALRKQICDLQNEVKKKEHALREERERLIQLDKERDELQFEADRAVSFAFQNVATLLITLPSKHFFLIAIPNK